ncbi:MAG: LysR family transcriptional regulator [Clostridia bacterium]|nr:LysR family transcriptional regulator [Clostridia bacterium]
MDLRQMKYFLAIAENASISKASEILHVAQPPLSYQLKLLEEELGVSLAERTTRKFELTDAGRILEHRSKQLLELLDASIKEIRDVSEGLKGTVSIGTVSSAGATLLPDKILSFHQQYPDVNFEIIDEDTARIVDMLERGVIDVGIIRTPFALDEFESITLPSEPMIAVCKDTDSFRKDVLEIRDLMGCSLIIQKRNEKLVSELCMKEGFEPRIICKSNDARTVLQWAETGLGVGLVPKNCLRLVPHTRLSFREIEEPLLMSGTAVIYPRNRYLSSAAKNFIWTLKTIS